MNFFIICVLSVLIIVLLGGTDAGLRDRFRSTRSCHGNSAYESHGAPHVSTSTYVSTMAQIPSIPDIPMPPIVDRSEQMRPKYRHRIRDRLASRHSGERPSYHHEDHHDVHRSVRDRVSEHRERVSNRYRRVRTGTKRRVHDAQIRRRLHHGAQSTKRDAKRAYRGTSRRVKPVARRVQAKLSRTKAHAKQRVIRRLSRPKKPRTRGNHSSRSSSSSTSYHRSMSSVNGETPIVSDSARADASAHAVDGSIDSLPTLDGEHSDEVESSSRTIDGHNSFYGTHSHNPMSYSNGGYAHYTHNAHHPSSHYSPNWPSYSPAPVYYAQTSPYGHTGFNTATGRPSEMHSIEDHIRPRHDPYGYPSHANHHFNQYSTPISNYHPSNMKVSDPFYGHVSPPTSSYSNHYNRRSSTHRTSSHYDSRHPEASGYYEYHHSSHDNSNMHRPKVHEHYHQTVHSHHNPHPSHHYHDHHAHDHHHRDLGDYGTIETPMTSSDISHATVPDKQPVDTIVEPQLSSDSTKLNVNNVDDDEDNDDDDYDDDDEDDNDDVKSLNNESKISSAENGQIMQYPAEPIGKTGNPTADEERDYKSDPTKANAIDRITNHNIVTDEDEDDEDDDDDDDDDDEDDAEDDIEDDTEGKKNIHKNEDEDDDDDDDDEDDDEDEDDDDEYISQESIKSIGNAPKNGLRK